VSVLAARRRAPFGTTSAPCGRLARVPAAEIRPAVPGD